MHDEKFLSKLTKRERLQLIKSKLDQIELDKLDMDDKSRRRMASNEGWRNLHMMQCPECGHKFRYAQGKVHKHDSKEN